MPLMEFECQTHGVFETMMSLSEYDKVKKEKGEAQAPCPSCDQPSKRVITKPHPKHQSWRV